MATLDDLLPKAADCRRRIAEVEAEKATELMRKENAADAEKRALLERLSHPSGVSDEERMKRAAAIVKRAVDNGLTEVMVGRFPNQLFTDRGRAINQQEAGWEKTLTGLPKELLDVLEATPKGAWLQGEIRDRRLSRRHAGRHRHHAELEMMAALRKSADDTPAEHRGSVARRQDEAQGVREGAAQAPDRTLPPAGVGEAQGTAGDRRLRGPRRGRQGRHHQGDHRTRQPARVPARRAAGPVGPREDADVHAALHAALPGCRRSRDLRPQLVQPRRRGARDGLLLGGAVSAISWRTVPEVEKYIVDGGIILIKFWLEVGKKEQERRFEARIDDPMRQWKLSPMDVESWTRWYDYSRARDMMLEATDTEHAPWYIVRSDDKKRARLNCIAHLLSLIPYKKVPREKVKLPKRSNKGKYDDQATLKGRRFVPEIFRFAGVTPRGCRPHPRAEGTTRS